MDIMTREIYFVLVPVANLRMYGYSQFPCVNLSTAKTICRTVWTTKETVRIDISCGVHVGFTVRSLCPIVCTQTLCLSFFSLRPPHGDSISACDYHLLNCIEVMIANHPAMQTVNWIIHTVSKFDIHVSLCNPLDQRCLRGHSNSSHAKFCTASRGGWGDSYNRIWRQLWKCPKMYL